LEKWEAEHSGRPAEPSTLRFSVKPWHFFFDPLLLRNGAPISLVACSMLHQSPLLLANCPTNGPFTSSTPWRINYSPLISSFWHSYSPAGQLTRHPSTPYSIPKYQHTNTAVHVHSRRSKRNTKDFTAMTSDILPSSSQHILEILYLCCLVLEINTLSHILKVALLALWLSLQRPPDIVRLSG
jgi:hypothetical protein